MLDPMILWFCKGLLNLLLTNQLQKEEVGRKMEIIVILIFKIKVTFSRTRREEEIKHGKDIKRE